MYFHLVLYVCIFVCNFYLIQCTSQPQVTLEQGILRGLYTKTFSNRQIASFKGIPYAKPPVGKHRFKEPVPASPWLGIYNATKDPPFCLQLDLVLTKSIHGTEDCLYINVYTPQLPNQNTTEPQLLDVLAFVHGGAFFGGESGNHGPSILFDRDVVLVTFNYRLGALGFLSTEDNVVPGNNGLKDQVLALKWIQKNIAAFGGNPDSVTLGGLSAGGASCHYHLLSPLSKGLFHKAICLSGVAINPWAMGENLKERTQVIATDLGCPTNDTHTMIKCMRNRPAEHIVSVTKKFVVWGTMFPLAVFTPVIELPSPTAFISDTPANIIKNKLGSDVPTILSFALDEGLCGAGEILNTPGMLADMQNRWDELIPQILDYNYTAPLEKRSEIAQIIKEKYKIDDSAEGRKTLIKMIGDRMFVSGISKVSKLMASAYTSPLYLYRFSHEGKHSLMDLFYKSEERLGVSHAEEIFYTLGYSNINFIEAESDAEMSKQMLNFFVSFIRNGSLGGNWVPMNQHLPKITFTDIKGPNNFQLTTVDELGEESFWDSLGFNENLKLPDYHYHHDEF